MKRSIAVAKTALLSLALVAVGMTSTACNKPSEADCAKAIDNVRRIAGTETDDFGTDRADMIRSCRGNAPKHSVDCMAKAKGAQELEKCEGGIYGVLFGGDAGADKKPDSKKPDSKKPDSKKPATP